MTVGSEEGVNITAAVVETDRWTRGEDDFWTSCGTVTLTNFQKNRKGDQMDKISMSEPIRELRIPNDI
jgi:hypothetical protein